MSTYATVLLTLHGVYLVGAIAREDKTSFFTSLFSTVLYLPVIGHAMGWW